MQLSASLSCDCDSTGSVQGMKVMAYRDSNTVTVSHTSDKPIARVDIILVKTFES